MEAQLLEDDLDLAHPPEALRPVTENRIGLIAIADDDDPARPGAEGVQRPVALTPLLEDQVSIVQAEPVKAAEQRQAARAWKISNRKRHLAAS